MENEVRPRRDGKGGDFGLAHRELPPFCGFTDIDLSLTLMGGNLLNGIDQEETTYVEYRTRNTKFVALFELKQHGSQDLKEALMIVYGSSVWAQYIMAQRLNCRFFIVTVNGKKKSPPHDFYEVFSRGNGENYYKIVGTLDYTTETMKVQINNFWAKLNLITPDEARARVTYLSKKNTIDYYLVMVDFEFSGGQARGGRWFSNQLETIQDSEVVFKDRIIYCKGKSATITLYEIRKNYFDIIPLKVEHV